MSYLFDKYPPGDRSVRILVVRANDPALRHLGGLPSPRLSDACADGRPREAWCQDGFWRLRDDAYDATHKPADVTYTRVLVGLNPREEAHA